MLRVCGVSVCRVWCVATCSADSKVHALFQYDVVLVWSALRKIYTDMLLVAVFPRFYGGVYWCFCGLLWARSVCVSSCQKSTESFSVFKNVFFIVVVFHF